MAKIKIGDITYNRVNVEVQQPEGVRLTLGALNRYGCHLTLSEAKRIGHALLLAADGIDP